MTVTEYASFCILIIEPVIVPYGVATKMRKWQREKKHIHTLLQSHILLF